MKYRNQEPVRLGNQTTSIETRPSLEDDYLIQGSDHDIFESSAPVLGFFLHLSIELGAFVLVVIAFLIVMFAH